VATFARQLARIERGLAPPVLECGDLSSRRDFLDVRDVVRAYHLALTRGEPGAVYNIGSGVAVRIADVLALLRGLARVPVEVAPEPSRMRPSDVPLLVADIRALRAATGWQPEIPFEQSVRDTLDWWRARVTRGVMSDER
jgi:GDP-4-dehydro-6-deoxy-D-mannose reductase